MKATTRAKRPAPASRAIRPRMPAVDVVVSSPLWKEHPKAKATARRALVEAATAAPTSGSELAIVLTDDAAIRNLNRDWRGIDKPTNVLSFPTSPQRDTVVAAPLPLGDIVIAYETTEREAQEQQKPFLHHLAHLVVHGFLHLVGHDHENDDDAEDMETIEIATLARLDIPDPYRSRDAAADH